MSAFITKEFKEYFRTGKFIILLTIFVLFGIMNPAIAKLTPWLVEVMSESMESSGLAVTEVVVDALTSWMQFYKNVPMALIIFVLICAGSFVDEYRKGTLVLVLTKGFPRWKVVLSKGFVISFLWTVFYWMHFGITYGYNEYFWDNCVVSNCFFGAFCYWLFGLWVIALMILFSTMASSMSGVLLGTGITVAAVYFAGFLRCIRDYVPTKLMDGLSLLTEQSSADEYIFPILIAALSLIICLLLSIVIFNKKKI